MRHIKKFSRALKERSSSNKIGNGNESLINILKKSKIANGLILVGGCVACLYYFRDSNQLDDYYRKRDEKSLRERYGSESKQRDENEDYWVYKKYNDSKEGIETRIDDLEDVSLFRGFLKEDYIIDLKSSDESCFISVGSNRADIEQVCVYDPKKIGVIQQKFSFKNKDHKLKELTADDLRNISVKKSTNIKLSPKLKDLRDKILADNYLEDRLYSLPKNLQFKTVFGDKEYTFTKFMVFKND